MASHGDENKIFNCAPSINIWTKVVNQNPENLLRCLVGENLRNWELILPRVEFTYNSSINRTSGMSPFEVVHGFKPRKSMDLILV